MATLAEALPAQQARCRALMSLYKQIGPAGQFGAALIEQALRNADQAVMSGDPVAMLRSLKELQEFKE
jgi:hypothetical protein